MRTFILANSKNVPVGYSWDIRKFESINSVEINEKVKEMWN